MKVALFAWAILAALVAVLLPGGVSNAQQPGAVDITLTDYKVSIPSAGIQAGVPVKFTVHNRGSITHEAVLEPAGAVDQALVIDGKEAELDDIAPGETRSVIWTLPRPGEYQVACHIPGHYEAGMVARFTVLASASSGQLAPQAAPEGIASSATTLYASAAPNTLPLTGKPGDLWQQWRVPVGAAAIIATLVLLVYGYKRRWSHS